MYSKNNQEHKGTRANNHGKNTNLGTNRKNNKFTEKSKNPKHDETRGLENNSAKQLSSHVFDGLLDSIIIDVASECHRRSETRP
ncbi:hypothetical protein RND71_006374 [Anisodus tanguticus]|uniref:Uncharacterized protein n=1 Tax=Anisodus tanguticus TaxID=243964 RepID=A0AAE1VNK2_9SOLA|nr:hypothetical protein RND71_006374 [Anisodus tanguticus]